VESGVSGKRGRNRGSEFGVLICLIKRDCDRVSDLGLGFLCWACGGQSKAGDSPE